MSKSNAPNINQILLDAHKLGVKNAIEASARSGVALVICENGKIKKIKPKYKYVRVEVPNSKRKKLTGHSRKK
jgi:hypothetical protein